MFTKAFIAKDDQQFISQMESCHLDPKYFDHLGHLRLAWLYLQLYGLKPAIEKTCNTIKAYAESLGAHDKFHYTLTDAIVRIMNKRMTQNETFEVFLKRNQDLVQDLLSVVLKHYRYETLFCSKAKKVQLPPDLEPL